MVNMSNVSMTSSGGSKKLAISNQDFVQTVVGFVYAAIALYITLALIYFEIKMTKNNPKTALNKTITQTLATYMRILCILSAFSAFLRLSFKTILIVDRSGSIQRCKGFTYFGFIMFFIYTLSVYGVLFLRQHVLATNKAIKNLIIPKSHVISILTFVMYVLVNVAFVSLNIATAVNAIRSNKCMFFGFTIPKGLARILKLSGMCTTQAILLILFIYPVLNHKKRTLKSHKTKGKQKSVLGLVWKSMTLSVICIITDVMTYVLSIVMARHLTVPLLLDTSMMINIICVVCTFKDFWKRFFPWFMTSAEQTPLTKPTQVTKSASISTVVTKTSNRKDNREKFLLVC